MAGTRRGAEREADSSAFEAANPFLSRVETTFEVIPNPDLEEGSDDYEFEPCSDDYYYGYDMPSHVPQVTQDGVEVPFDTYLMWTPFNFSTAYSIYSPIGDLMPGYDEDSYDEDELSMSDYGFGVWSDEESPYSEGPVKYVYMDEDVEPNPEAVGLNDDETLQFYVNTYGYYDGPDYPMGGVSFEIDYMVLEGSGSVEIDLYDYGYDLGGGSTGPLSEGDTGSLKVNGMDGYLFNEAEVSVDGTVVVGITGITVTTNFEGMFFDT